MRLSIAGLPRTGKHHLMQVLMQCPCPRRLRRATHGQIMYAYMEKRSLCLTEVTIPIPAACVSTVIAPTPKLGGSTNAWSPTGLSWKSPWRIQEILISVNQSTSTATRSLWVELLRVTIGAPHGYSSVVKTLSPGSSGSRPPRCSLRTPREIDTAIYLATPSRSTEGPSP